ncbi:MAG: tRNA (adenosine(37)-N6)-threonylcarbamoyltransferase complex dimerization subunit type 1 TsaB [Betaproteobacteria bacterium]|jgi:tRNA threonylcarbamoyladenosine biosynthesis protein TsaB|nr:tRNA (adenosine(37)-N6)-threonylcarbamoyltransferase complex dimerization subunit type 1 TsaB [Betaproteobacteria bacterium]
MKLLALETSTEHLSVAACAGTRQAVREVAGGAQASFTLLPAIEAVLGELELAVHDLDAIAFGQGPGAFTGLRTACAVAQGLALGSGVPLLPIDSLSQVAQSVRTQLPTVRRVLVTLDARMAQVYWGALQWQEDHWHAVLEVAVSDPQAVHWPSGWQASDDTVVAGSWVSPEGDLRQQVLGPHAWHAARPTAQALLALAPAAWQRGLAVAPEDAAPFYVRNKVAQTTAERQAQHPGGRA